MKKILCILSLFVLQLCFGQQTYDALVEYQTKVKFGGQNFLKGQNLLIFLLEI